MIGGSIAHIITIGIALVIEKIVERFLTERLINIIGGIMFICFAFWELYYGVLKNDEFDK